MNDDLLYSRGVTPPGIKVEIVAGGAAMSPKVRLALARQIWSENGRDGYRAISHLDCGAPICEGEDCRISLTHTNELLAIASLPRTPEADLTQFSPRTALGIDAERLDRRQALSVRDRFLMPEEAALAGDDPAMALRAWTAKEAAYKAILAPDGFPMRTGIRLLSLPDPCGGTEGEAEVTLPGGGEPIRLCLYSFIAEGYLITLAYSPKCATYKKKTQR